MSKILFNKEKAFTAFDAIDFTNVTICVTRDCPRKQMLRNQWILSYSKVITTCRKTKKLLIVSLLINAHVTINISF